MSRVLVLGASGYVGGRLVPRLLAAGHLVRCLTRNADKLATRPWSRRVEIREGDLSDRNTLAGVFDDVDVVVYLVHSLDTGAGFEERELQTAVNAREEAGAAGVGHLVYLGGLGEADDDLSPHLASRHAVGRALADGPVPVVELRAAVIVGSGSASFEMLRGLVEVLPAMIVPKWVRVTRCQPIAIEDVLDRLLVVVDRPDLEGVWEIGGGDVVTYEEAMQMYADVVGLRRRRMLPVPVLTPGLSARWVNLVTTLPGSIAGELVEGLQNDVVVGDRSLDEKLGLSSLGMREAIAAAVEAVQDLDIPTRWTPRRSGEAARPRSWDPDWAGGTVYTDERSALSSAPPDVVMSHVRRVGGENGWFGFRPLWAVRALADELLGGPGWHRGRRHPSDLAVGDVIDVFVVEALADDQVRLRADMLLPGHGWLEWGVVEVDEGTRLFQTARYVPKGLAGRLYWWSVVPFHALVFGRMVRRIADAASADVASVSS